MAVPWGLVTFIIGIAYGLLKPGRQQKGQLFKTGLLIGVVLAVVFALLGYAVGANPIGIGAGFVGLVIAAVVLSLLFVLGVWIGDLIEGRPKRT